MKIKEIIKKMKEDKLTVNCPTEELANEFLKGLHQEGVKWRNGSSLMDYNNWGNYSQETTYINYECGRLTYQNHNHCLDVYGTITRFKGWDDGEIVEKSK